MKKLFTLSAALVALSAMAADNIVVNGPDGVQLIAMSANGVWTAGDNVYSEPVLWNTETGNILTKEGYEVQTFSVSNDGVVVGSSHEYAFKMDAEGNFTYLDGEPGDILSTARGISADGSIIVGCRYDSAYNMTAGYWKDGSFHVLPVPTDEETGYGVNGANCNGVTADGRIILGYLVDDMASNPFVLWKLNDATGEYEFVNASAEYFEPGYGDKPYYGITGEGISPDGKWVSCTLSLNSWDDWALYVGRYNVETGELERAANIESAEEGCAAANISNNGVIIGYTEANMVGSQGLIWIPGTSSVQTLASYVDNNPEAVALDALTNRPIAISADGTKVGGFYLDENGAFKSYVMTIPPVEGVGVAAIESDLQDINAIYDLQGRKVAVDSLDGLATGIYIVKSGKETRKVVVK